MLDSLPAGWRNSKIGEFAIVKTGGTPSRKKEEFWGGDIKWMASGEVWQRHIVDTIERITGAGMGASAAKLLPRHSVMIALNGQGRTRGTAAILQDEMTCNQSLAAILPSDKHDPFFLLQFIESKYRDLRALTGDNARNGLNLGLIKNFSVLLPPLFEQQRIAEILTSVDDSIRATEAVITQSERVKRGLMEDLLTGGLGSAAIARGEVPEGWKDCTFDQLVLSIVGGVSVNSLNTPAADGEKGVLKTSAVSDGWFDMNENKVVFDEKEIARLKEPIQAGTIIFSRMNTPKLVGANAYVAQRNENTFLPDRLWAIKPNETKVDANWLGFWMHHQFKTGSFEALGTGTSGSMKNISKKKLNAMKVAKPTLEKQMHVVSVLNAVNDQILSNRSSLAQLQRLKRGLMDDLLTGRVRTV